MGSSDGTAESDTEEYTPQPEALRKQQFYLAVVGSVMGGVAVAVSIVQRYPEYTILGIIAGGISAAVLFRLVSGSIFPGASETASTDQSTEETSEPSSEADTTEETNEESTADEKTSNDPENGRETDNSKS